MDAIKDKWIGTIGTVGIHVILIAILLLIHLNPAENLRFSEDYGGVPVMLGNAKDAFGQGQSKGHGDGTSGETVSTSPNVVEDAPPLVEATSHEKAPQVANTNTPVATQDIETTAAIKEANREAEVKKAREAEEQRQVAEQERIAQQQAEQRDKINKLTGGALGAGDGSNTDSYGHTQGEGYQGSSGGNSREGKTSGIGGRGTFDLGGRSTGSGGLINPAYNVNDQGTVVVSILVTPTGEVIEATIGKGTNTANASLLNEALKAARKTKFNQVSSVTNQRGAITYTFKLN